MSLSFSGYQTQSVRFQDELEASTSEVLGATGRQAISELPSTSVYRMAELGNAQLTGQRIDADSARQRITDAGLTGQLTVGDDGMTSESLDILIERKRKEVKRQEVLNRAPGGFGMGAAQLGTAFAASMLDPVNVGMAFVPIVGEARYLRYLANARGVLGRTAVRTGVGAAEGVAGAALIEPLVYAAKLQEQADYDFQDSLLNVAFGTVFGGGLHAVAGGLSDAARALRETRAPAARLEPTVDGVRAADLDHPIAPIMASEMPPAGSAAARAAAADLPVREATLRTAVAQAIEGKQVQVEPIMRQPGVEQIVEVDPRTLTFREADQNRTEQVRELFQEGEGYDPIVSIVEEGGERTILDGHNRAAVAMERGGPLRAAQLLRSEYEALRSDEFDDMEIAYATLTAAGDDEAASRLARQFAGSNLHERGTSAWQKLDGLRDARRGASDSSDIRAEAERLASPESEVTADVRASQAADEQLAATSPVTDAIAEQERAIADQLADLKDVARIAGIDLKEELAEFDELISQAETYGKAARAAALCGLGH